MKMMVIRAYRRHYKQGGTQDRRHRWALDTADLQKYRMDVTKRLIV